MYAVIATGGKQYKVAPGDDVTIEKLDGEVGATVNLRPIMLVGDDGGIKTGDAIGDAQVTGTIKEQMRTPKLRVFTYKNKTRQHKRRGHRQHLTVVTIDKI